MRGSAPREIDFMATVLILDRERRSRRELYSLLAAPYAAVAVHGLHAAVRFLRHHRPDLVVVKANGNDELGVTMLLWLGEHGLRIPTIVLLSHGVTGNAGAIRKLGATAILRYPVGNVELLRAITAANAHAGDNGTAAHTESSVTTLPSDGICRRCRRKGDGVRSWCLGSRIAPSVGGAVHK